MLKFPCPMPKCRYLALARRDLVAVHLKKGHKMTKVEIATHMSNVRQGTRQEKCRFCDNHFGNQPQHEKTCSMKIKMEKEFARKQAQREEKKRMKESNENTLMVYGNAEQVLRSFQLFCHTDCSMKLTTAQNYRRKLNCFIKFIEEEVDGFGIWELFPTVEELRKEGSLRKLSPLIVRKYVLSTTPSNSGATLKVLNKLYDMIEANLNSFTDMNKAMEDKASTIYLNMAR